MIDSTATLRRALFFAAFSLLACQGGSSATVGGLTLDDASQDPAGLRVGAGLSEAVVNTGVHELAALATSPDGRLFVADRQGHVSFFAYSSPAPIALLHLAVDAHGQTGVLGLAVGAGSTAQPSLYVLYLASAPYAHPRLSRLELAAGPVHEVVLVDFERAWHPATINGGLCVGPDGALYVGLGDDGVGANAQDLTSAFGKVLRFSADGKPAAGNPFAARGGVAAQIFASGFRSPSPTVMVDGTLVVADEGVSQQEINLVEAGQNLGWPLTEGTTIMRASSAQLRQPQLTYARTGNAGCSLHGLASASLPAASRGLYFFADGCTGRIRSIDFKAGTVATFARGLADVSALAVTADGALLAASRSEGAVHAIRFEAAVTTAPAIVTQPASLSVTEGTAVTFSVGATGTAPLTFQWLRNGVALTSQTSSTLAFTATLADSGASFKVQVTNTKGAVTSSAATLTVAPAVTPPSITAQPASQSVTEGQPATFTVGASGTGPLAFQWRRDGVSLPDAGAPSFSFTTALADDGASFDVVVSSDAGVVTSARASLSVAQMPTVPAITTQPQDLTALDGDPATFSVIATGGGPLAYQWRAAGAAIDGGTGSSYTRTAVLGDAGGPYDVVVSNALGTVVSRAAALVVNPAPPRIVTQPADVSATVGTPATFTVVATGTGPLSYQWSENGTPVSGASSPTWSFVTTTADDGAKIEVLVSNAVGSLSSQGAGLTVTPVPRAPSIDTQPASVTVSEGQSASFTVAASGTAPLSYQWYRAGAAQADGGVPLTAIADAGAAILAFTAALPDNGTSFAVSVSNVAGAQTSALAVLTVTPVVIAPTITASPASVSILVGQPAAFSVTATGTAPLTYQWRKSGAAIAGATAASFSFVPAESDTGATIDVIVSNAAGSATSAAAVLTVNRASVSYTKDIQPIWNKYCAGCHTGGGASGGLKLDAAVSWAQLVNHASSCSASVLEVKPGNPAASELWLTLANDPAQCGGNMPPSAAGLKGTDAVAFQLVQRWIELGALNDAPALPSISTQPASASVAAGQTATFSVAATGAVPLSYQWRRGGTAITGATSASYGFTAVSADTGASFDVVVSNAAGSVTSSAAVLTVTAAAVSYSKDIQPIWSKYCSGCHTGGGGSGGLKLDASVSWAQLVNKTSSCNTSLLNVKPGSPSSSELWLTLANDPNECGGVMPPGGSGGLKAQDAAAFQLVTTWIQQGATNQ